MRIADRTSMPIRDRIERNTQSPAVNHACQQTSFLQPVWPLIFASNITRSMPALGVKLPAKKIAAIKGVVYIICIVRYR
ncbi:hypothetical protein NLZ08_12565 [Escherichia coli]|nr:hypothetical protein [Escherichia coli]UTJ64982.1 hypothetical protein NLZ08_12565 [Escherichia coli]